MHLLIKQDGCKMDIFDLSNLLERPLTGLWADKYPNAVVTLKFSPSARDLMRYRYLIPETK